MLGLETITGIHKDVITKIAGYNNQIVIDPRQRAKRSIIEFKSDSYDESGIIGFDAVDLIDIQLQMH